MRSSLSLFRLCAVGLTLSLTGVLMSRCGSRGGGEETAAQAVERHPLPDTLRIGTLYSPTSYFIYRDQEMGYDYSLISQWAEEKDMVVDLKVAPSLPRLIEMLDSAEVDIAAYEIPVTAEYRQSVIPCGPEYITTQVLVQPLKNGRPEITDETQLVGKDVYVEAGSKYQYRLRNLDNELGGGIRIHEVARDTLITEDLIGMVSDGTIPLTVVDSDIARINKTYYRDFDVSLPLSFPQKASWGVAAGNKWLADSVDAWFVQESPKRRQAELLKRYFELGKNGGADPLKGFSLDLSKGTVSPYDAIFRANARTAGRDWRLLAAIGYVESGFNSNLVSWAGARGIMQIMPRSAVAYGLPLDQHRRRRADFRRPRPLAGPESARLPRAREVRAGRLQRRNRPRLRRHRPRRKIRPQSSGLGRQRRAGLPDESQSGVLFRPCLPQRIFRRTPYGSLRHEGHGPLG